jgi:hypothetical protein
VPSGKETQDGLGEFFPHLSGCCANVLQRAAELSLARWREARG